MEVVAGMDTDFAQFITWAFYGFIGSGIWFTIHMLSNMTDSINSLNINVAKLLQTTKHHELQLIKFESKISELEFKTYNQQNQNI